jgi:hypothetical protein
MKKFVVITLIVLATMAYGSDIITVEFTQFHETMDNPVGSGLNWLSYTPESGGGWYWVEQFITVVIKRNGVVIDTRSTFQVRNDTESTLDDLADDATGLYADLERQEQLIAESIYNIDQSINNPNSQDKAHTKLTETLLEQKREYERIQAEIDATMEDLRTEEGTGNLGWFEYN